MREEPILASNRKSNRRMLGFSDPIYTKRYANGKQKREKPEGRSDRTLAGKGLL